MFNEHLWRLTQNKTAMALILTIAIVMILIVLGSVLVQMRKAAQKSLAPHRTIQSTTRY